jgi:thiol-disulfide isomerase/thioredoxin/outer membrane lipoprotein-sorting protein
MFFPIALALVLLPLQSEKPAAGQDALALLKEVGQRYADAKSYHIEAVEERNSSNELERSWQKTLMKAVMMPGGRYRYEGRSGYGAGMYVSDGTTQWIYRVHGHAYTQKPADPGSLKHRIITGEEMPAVSARELVRIIAHRADHLKSAALLPEQTITVGATAIPCYVVHYTEQDFKTKNDDLKNDWTLWISKQEKTLLKTLSHIETFLLPDHIPISEETTVLYEVVKLDQLEPDDTFTFVAPSDAKLVDKFPEPFRDSANLAAGNLLGKPAPELSLKAADGKVLTLSSLRGKPVFLEFWATWCGPCVETMPDLKKLYAETESKGLAWVSIDNDEDAKTASEFVSKETIPWPNYHDEDGSLGRAYQRQGIPLGVLIDGEGKITFYESGYEISELRAAIAKLGPQFSPLAASSKP